MTTRDLLALLVEFLRDKAALYQRHVAVARVAGQYDVNNAYQYVIAREEQHLSWLREAVLQVGGEEPEPPAAVVAGRPRDEEGLLALAREDAAALASFVEKWRPRLGGMPSARHRLMLELTLGEMLEQRRLFEQAGAGRQDLLGRRTGGPRTGGQVLSARWVE